MLLLNVPFGGSMQRPRWEGLGTPGTSDSSRDIWRPVENLGAIQTVQRVGLQDATEIQAGSLQVEARFLQTSAETGDTVDVEVSLSETAHESVRLTVRLVPGGTNPAVPGVDYIDEPVSTTIIEGETTAQVSFQLLENPDLQSERTLSVTVSLAS